MARKKKPEEHVNHERWMVSYADFMTLLFATFTALFAISNADLNKLMALKKSVNKAFGNDRLEIDGPRLSNVLTDGSGDKTGGLIINLIPNAGPASPVAPVLGDPGAATGGSKLDEAEDDGEFREMPHPTGGNEEEGYNEDAVGYGPESGTGLTENDGWGSHTEGERSEQDGDTGLEGEKTGKNGGEGKNGEGEGNLGNAQGSATAELQDELQKLMEDIDLGSKIEVRREGRGSVISLGETAFFSMGDARLLPESKVSLGKIVRALQGKSFEIRIEGHTDNTPVSPGSRWTSNLQLSMVRSANIVEFMVDQYHFNPAQLSGAGFGDTRPIASNDTPQGRARNRRVDIVILTPGGESSKITIR